MRNLRDAIAKHRGDSSQYEARLLELITEFEDVLKAVKGSALKELKAEILAEVKARMDKEEDPNNLSVLTKIVRGVLHEVRGKDGERGEKGDKGDSIIGPIGPKPVAGVDYPIPKDGKRGPAGKASQIPGPMGPMPVAGKDFPLPKDGSPDTPQQVRDKLASLKGDERITKDAIKGLAEELAAIMSTVRERTGGKQISGGGTHITVSATAPSNPHLKQLWVDTS